jgi:plasmid stabilization system protein ParE
MPFRVITLGRADRDLVTIARWLLKRSPRGARRWLLAFEEAKDKLRESPLAHGLAPEDSRVDFELRQIFFKTRRGKSYRAVFTVVDDEIRILRVRGPHQRLLRRKEMPLE